MNHVGSSVNLHIIKDDKILLLRRISKRWMDGKLQIPGGHTEPGESPTDAVLREAREELGLILTASDIKCIGTVFVKDDTNEYFAIQFRLLDSEAYEYAIAEPEKCSELVWVTLGQLPEDVIPIFTHTLREFEAGNNYVEFTT